MSLDPSFNARQIRDRQQLIDYFRHGEKERHRRGIGTEHEKFVIRRDNGAMLSFEEPGGFGDLFEQLAQRPDWRPAPLDNGHLVSVVSDDSGITLEPGGQFELSGKIARTIFETADEFDAHLDELKELAGDELLFVIWGMNPAVELDDVPWMPKARYRIMREYLPTRGTKAHWMMKATCTVQANFDYCSEDDAVDLIHTAVLASPVVGALFANSPLQAGENTGYQSRRNYIWWNHTDPDRTGVPSFMYHRDWGYQDYLEYVFDVPMFFIQRDGELVDMAGFSFRKFVAEGFQDYRATIADFELHLSTLFPDVRLKQFIEVRSADGGPRDFVLALPALWKGLLYDDDARKDVVTLFESIDEQAHRKLVETCYRDGLHGQSELGPIEELADELVSIAETGLQNIAARDGHRSESEFLTPLKERLLEGRSLADLLVDDFKAADGRLLDVAEKWAL